MWGIRDLVEYRHRIALAQLADVLTVEESLILPSLPGGLGQVFDAFGPELGCEVLKTGRILTVPMVPSLGFIRLAALEEELQIHLSRSAVTLFSGRYESATSRPVREFIKTALEHSVIEPTEDWAESVEKSASRITTGWREDYGDFLGAAWFQWVESDRWHMRSHSKEALDEAVRSFAAELSAYWSLGSKRAYLPFEIRDFLGEIGGAAARHPPSLTAVEGPAPLKRFEEILSFESVPRPGILVMRGDWGAADVFECITRPDTKRLRSWMRKHASSGGNLSAAYQSEEDRFSGRKLQRRTIRFLITTSIATAFAHCLSVLPPVAEAFGIGVSAIDQFLGDRLFEPWLPQIWMDEFARSQRRTAAANHEGRS
jgi:hypothetical protein